MNCFSRTRCWVTRSKSVPCGVAVSAAPLVDGAGVHVLELVGEHVGLHGQIMDGGFVIVLGGDLEVGHLTGRQFGVGSSTPTRKPM